MAEVRVDLSEYDMLREAKNEAEKEVEELKETVKSLKNKSRVILTTRYKYYAVDTHRIALEIYRQNMRGRLPISETEIADIVKRSTKGCAIHSMSETDSSQYIGFDDVRVQVENHYKNEIDRAIQNYKDSEKEYHKLRESVEDSVKDMYLNTIDQLKDDIKSKDEEIKSLKSQITELSKSKDERIAELMVTIKEAQSKLDELDGKRKGLFSKIFK